VLRSKVLNCSMVTGVVSCPKVLVRIPEPWAMPAAKSPYPVGDGVARQAVGDCAAEAKGLDGVGIGLVDEDVHLCPLGIEARTCCA